jgi:hypothetical protein
MRRYVSGVTPGYRYAPYLLNGLRSRIRAVDPPGLHWLAVRRNDSNNYSERRFGVRGLMEIGDPERTFTVEPLEDPVPREHPAEPGEHPARPSPAEEPIEAERVPAP